MIVFQQQVRDALGLDKCKFALTGAAPIAVSTVEFFGSLGISICEVFGMSECSGPATVATPGFYKAGARGVALLCSWRPGR